jgi:hypothetical protein
VGWVDALSEVRQVERSRLSSHRHLETEMARRGA